MEWRWKMYGDGCPCDSQNHRSTLHRSLLAAKTPLQIAVSPDFVQCIPLIMATDVQVKLLTLLNVSAIKRPLDIDRPGGWRSNSQTSNSSPKPQAQEADQANDNDEPPKKKRRGVSFGGEMGPTGSARAEAKPEKPGKKDKERIKGIAANGNGHRDDSIASAASMTEESESSLVMAADDDSVDEDEAATSAKNAVAGKPSTFGSQYFGSSYSLSFLRRPIF